MRFGVPIMGDRVAPRCSYAEGIVIVTVSHSRIIKQNRLSTPIRSPVELISLLRDSGVDTLICGGVSNTVRELLYGQGTEIIDNVTQSIEDVLDGIRSGKYLSGQGDTASAKQNAEPSSRNTENLFDGFNCVNCDERFCLQGESCFDLSDSTLSRFSEEARQIIEASMDISNEEPRRLCRLAELVYFCLEMNYSRIGVAFCVDMWEPTQILIRVLGRFFEVVPVCCKVGGINESALLSHDYSWKETSRDSIACNPIGQAYVLNKSSTHFNVVVGLCIGADALFSMESNAPTSTLFVKDKSLANNPIGALYSEYYLRESEILAEPRNPRARREPQFNNRQEDKS